MGNLQGDVWDGDVDCEEQGEGDEDSVVSTGELSQFENSS